MSKRTFAVVLFWGLTITFLMRPIWNQTTVYSLTENYTVPSRTPVPPTKNPTNGSGSGSGNIEPTATNALEEPTVTETAVSVTVASTPAGGFVPTAEACGERPTIQAVNTTRVRFGPGTDYEIVNELVYLEVRPIIGRAANTNWWQIVLADNTIGWVSDDIVTVQGNISVLPIAAAPALDGVEPTAGTPWTPPLKPGCSVAAVWTSTPQPTAVSPTATPLIPTETPASAEDVAEAVEDTGAEQVVEEGGETAVSPTTPPQPTKPPTPIPTAAPIDVRTQSTNVGFLPIAAAVLLAAGGVVTLLRRNRG